jgi:hypothetical protein
VCVLFYQKTANLSSFYQILNLRNLLYFIGKTVKPVITGFLDLDYITKQGGRTAALFVSANTEKKLLHTQKAFKNSSLLQKT